MDSSENTPALRQCPLCGATCESPERASVRSNVRAFLTESFPVWRCDTCQSIHADADVDLAPYYAVYPFFRQTLDWTLRAVYRRLVRRLRRAGLRKEHRILDFGCGSGHLVAFLKEKGYQAVGFDPYSETHNTPELLETTYDVVIAQDVVEHHPEPMGLFAQWDRLVKPGGLIFIGTPNASGMDLSDPERFVHPLHQPYHRHIFSLEALRAAATGQGWLEKRYYDTPYTNMPVLSLPFLHHYMKSADGTIDVLFDRDAPASLWCNPKTYGLLLAGYFLCDNADIVMIFEKK